MQPPPYSANTNSADRPTQASVDAIKKVPRVILKAHTERVEFLIRLRERHVGVRGRAPPRKLARLAELRRPSGAGRRRRDDVGVDCERLISEDRRHDVPPTARCVSRKINYSGALAWTSVEWRGRQQVTDEFLRVFRAHVATLADVITDGIH